ncbi:hypothetical protein GIB67_007712 [Kingdonia uniflora]|uniref:Uncharacterized protein n=1 Tax=Kingdonia uniflora TaxID=39325 RepID=A0A7J7N1K3_9MAGN|nr:hypothetical protein GIB67_007712 [Kingdonia uniflora]
MQSGGTPTVPSASLSMGAVLTGFPTTTGTPISLPTRLTTPTLWTAQTSVTVHGSAQQQGFVLEGIGEITEKYQWEQQLMCLRGRSGYLHHCKDLVIPDRMFHRDSGQGFSVKSRHWDDAEQRGSGDRYGFHDKRGRGRSNTPNNFGTCSHTDNYQPNAGIGATRYGQQPQYGLIRCLHSRSALAESSNIGRDKADRIRTKLVKKYSADWKGWSKSVDDYASDFYILSSRVVLFESEAQRVSHFCLGLTKRIQDEMILFSPQSLSETVEMAHRVKTKLKPSGYPSYSVPAPVTSTPTSTAPTVGGNPVGIVRTSICYNCGKTRHMRLSFGSLTVVTVDQLLEFWYGHVNSGKPFLWVMRPDSIAGTDGDRQIPRSFWRLLSRGDQQINSWYISEVWEIGLDMKDKCDRATVEKMVRGLMDDKREELPSSTDKIGEMVRSSIKEGGSSFRNFERLIEDIRSMSLQTFQS